MRMMIDGALWDFIVEFQGYDFMIMMDGIPFTIFFFSCFASSSLSS